MNDSMKVELCERAIDQAWVELKPTLLYNHISTAFIYLEGCRIVLKLGSGEDGYFMTKDTPEEAAGVFAKLKTSVFK